MAKHPVKNHDVEEEKMDSTRHMEERKAKYEAEAAEHKKTDQAAVDRNTENQEIANFKGLPKEGETREQLLDRIRKMREEVQKPGEATIFRSEGLQKEYDAEVKAGQEAVAKVKAEAEHYRALVQKAEGEKKVAG